MNVLTGLLIDEVKKVFMHFNNENELDSEFQIIGLDLSYICHYDSRLEEVVVDCGRGINLPNDLAFIHQTTCYDSRIIGMDRAGRSRYLYSSPIILNQEVKYFLICTSDVKHDSFTLLILEMLSTFISSRLETHLKLQEIF